MNAFDEHIQTALANPVLQSALDGNAERRLNALSAAFASLPEERAVLRRQAHAVRAETIAHLDHYLAQFIAQAQANGIQVHQAADGAQAVQLVLDIARRHGVQRVAKSKSMVSEEVQLNPALEAAGMQVVETDLGEYIIQLRHEPPAHIITPAVHLTRRQVGQTFAAELGIPFTEDIPTLTATARRVLRQTFLEADLGISGVNFGVAQTGTLCLVTNEGNGRMCTTLPPVHVALMGLERLVPSLADLALMLSMLPRSATGQKLSVYTSLIHAPRRADESDGPQERHLILLDNGRRRMHASPLQEALLCIRCGACLNACPVFREIGGHAYRSQAGQISPYPGPIGSVVAPGLFGVTQFGHLARASTLCGACKDACPVDIDLPKLLLRIRAGLPDPAVPTSLAEAPHAPWGLRLFLRLFTWAARSPWRYRLAQRAAGLFSRLAGRGGWLRLPAFTGWGLAKDFPAFAGRTFQRAWAGQAVVPAVAPAPSPAAPAAAHAAVAPAPASAATDAPAFAWLLLQEGDDPARLAQRFTTELIALGGDVLACSESELAGQVLALLRAEGISELQAWSGEHLPPGLADELSAQGIRLSTQPQAHLHAGLSGASLGIAESGSILVCGAPGQPLTASLLPEIHLALLYQRDIVARLPQALAHPGLAQAGAAAIITGPSRTADIEMTLTIGVHGPARLVVFLIDGI